MAALLEFVLNRLAQPLWAVLIGGSSTVLTGISRYSLNLGTVLGLMTLVTLLFRAISRGGAASRPLGRLAVLTFGTLLCGLALFLILVPSQAETKRIQWLVQMSAVAIALLIGIGVLAPPPSYLALSSRSRGRFKFGLILLLLPPLLLLETQWGLFTNIRLLQRYGLLTLLYGPVLAVAALGGGALYLTSLPRRPLIVVPMFCATLATTMMAYLLHRVPNFTMRLIYMSFDLRLPPHAEAYALYLISLCGWVFAVTALLLGQASMRARGLGLLLIGLGGCQAHTLHQMLFYLCGLLCVAESLLHSDAGSVRIKTAERAASAA